MADAHEMDKENEVVPQHLSRDQVLRLLAMRGEELREELAQRRDAEPEVLAFIAREGSVVARRAVAANPAASAETNRFLATSRDDEVRGELARKIGRLLPGLCKDMRDEVRNLTVETLQCLADDQLPRVREILAEEIKEFDCVPKSVIDKLARDIESVSVPILEYSPLLSDSDLIDIITSAQARHALTSIAKRKPLSASVSDAIAAAMDIPSVAALLKNSNAHIRQKTLDKIIEHAEPVEDWHNPLVLRNDLSQRAIRRIASFVSASLIEQLAKRHDLSDETQDFLRERAQARLECDANLGSAAAVVNARYSAGSLDDRFVISATQDGERSIVVHALARLAAAPVDIVHRVLESRLAKPVTALVWRAGLSMRVAFKIQTVMLHLSSADLLPARNGVHFPLTEEEMRWHLSYFGLEE